MSGPVRQNPNVMVGTVNGTPVLFNLEDRQLHSLNETASACWELLKTASTEEMLVSAVSQTYGLEEDALRKDVRAVLGIFQAAHLCGPEDEFQDLAANSKPRTITVSRELKPSTIGPFSALGIRALVDVEDQDLRADLTKILAPLVFVKDFAPYGCKILHKSCEVMIDVVVRRVGDRWSVSINGQQSAMLASREAAIRQVVATINSKPIDYIDDAVVFHAAAAEFDTGVSIFPGVSNAGKSTLITQLVERGHKYVSDEAVAVTAADHRVVAFPKSISIDTGSQELLRPLTGVPQCDTTIDVDPRTIGPGRISSGGTVKRIIFPEYRPSTPTVFESLDPFDAFNRLLANSFCFDTAGQVAFDAVVSLANNVPSFALAHSGDVDHLEVIEALVAKSPPVLRVGSAVRQ